MEGFDLMFIILDLKNAVSKLSQISCGDKSCVFNPPEYVSTNGGCRCLKHLNSADRNLLHVFYTAVKPYIKEEI